MTIKQQNKNNQVKALMENRLMCKIYSSTGVVIHNAKYNNRSAIHVDINVTGKKQKCLRKALKSIQQRTVHSDMSARYFEAGITYNLNMFGS